MATGRRDHGGLSVAGCRLSAILLFLSLAGSPAGAADPLPPAAKAGEDVKTFAGATVALDASASYDPQGLPLSFLWRFDDGHPDEAGAKVERPYFLPGVFKAKVVVSNGTLSSEDELEVAVGPGPIRDGGEPPPPAGVSGGTILSFFPKDPRLVRALSISIDGEKVSDTNLYRWDTRERDAEDNRRWKNGEHAVVFSVDYGEGSRAAPWKGVYRQERTYLVAEDRQTPFLSLFVSDQDPARPGVQPVPRVNGVVWLVMRSPIERALMPVPGFRVQDGHGKILAQTERPFLRWEVCRQGIPDGDYQVETYVEDEQGNRLLRVWTLPLRHDPGAAGEPALNRASPPSGPIPFGAFFPLDASPNQGSSLEWSLGSRAHRGALPEEVKENDYHALMKFQDDPPVFVQACLGLSKTTKELGSSYGGNAATLSSAKLGPLLKETFPVTFESAELGEAPSGGILGAAIGQLPEGVWPGEDFPHGATVPLRGYAADAYKGKRTGLLKYRVLFQGLEVAAPVPQDGVADLPTAGLPLGGLLLEQSVSYAYGIPCDDGVATRSVSYTKTIPFSLWQGTLGASSSADDPDTPEVEYFEDNPVSFEASFLGTSIPITRGRWYVDMDPGEGISLALVLSDNGPALDYAFPAPGRYRVEFRSLVRTAWDPVQKNAIRRGIEEILAGGQEFLEREVKASLDIEVKPREVRSVVVTQSPDDPGRWLLAYTLTADFPEGIAAHLFSFREGPSPTIPMARQGLADLPNTRGRHQVAWDGRDRDGTAIDLRAEVGTVRRFASNRNLTIKERETEQGEVTAVLEEGVKSLSSVRSDDLSPEPLSVRWTIPEEDRAIGAILKEEGLDPRDPRNRVFEVGDAQRILFVPLAVGNCRIRLLKEGMVEYPSGRKLEDERYTVLAHVIEVPYKVRVVDQDGDEVNLAANVSDPHPVITLDPISPKQVQIKGNIAVFTVKGSVTDALADIVEGGKADIPSVSVAGADVPLKKVADTPSEWRPYAFKARFEKKVALPLADGDNTLEIACKNLIGNEGFAHVNLKAKGRYSANPAAIGGVYPFSGILQVRLDIASSSAQAAVPGARCAVRLLAEPDQPDDPNPEWLQVVDAGRFEYEGLVPGVGQARFRLGQLPAALAAGNAPPPAPPKPEDLVPPVLDPEIEDQLRTVIWAEDGQRVIQLKEVGKNSGSFQSVGDEIRIFLPSDGIKTNRRDVVGLEIRPRDAPPRSTQLGEAKGDTQVFEGADGKARVSLEVLEVLAPSKPGERGTILALLTHPAYSLKDEHVLFLGTRTGGSQEYRLAGPRLRAGGLALVSPVLLTFRILNLTTDSTEAGVSNPIRIEFDDDHPAGQARFGGRPFDVVRDREGKLQLDPLMIGLKRPPPAALGDTIKNIFCMSNSDFEAGVAYKASFVPLDFAAVADVDTSHLKRAPGTETFLTLESAYLDRLLSRGAISFPGGRINIGKIESSEPVPGSPTRRRVRIRVRVWPDKRMGFETMEFAAEAGRVAFKKALEITPLRVVVFAIDGGQYAALDQAYREGVTVPDPGDPGKIVVERAEAFQKLFGAGYEHAVNLSPALDVMPSITWANWPTIVTGLPPRTTGIMGNSFFARDIPGLDPIGSANYPGVPFAHLLNPRRKKLGLPPEPHGDNDFNYRVMVWGWMDEWLRGEPVEFGKPGDAGPPRTLYEQVKAVDPAIRTAEAYHFLARGADDSIRYEGAKSILRTALQAYADSADAASLPEKLVRFFPGGVIRPGDLREGIAAGDAALNYSLLLSHHDRGTGILLDSHTAALAGKWWARSEAKAPEVLLMYMPAPDNYGHAVGRDEHVPKPNEGEDMLAYSARVRPLQVGSLQNTLAKMIVESTDVQLGRFLNVTERMGRMNTTVFVFAADHGLVGFFSHGVHARDRDRRALALDEQREREMRQVIESLNAPSGRRLTVWDGLDLKGAWCVFSPDGGMSHIYLRGIFGWDSPPTDDFVLKVANKIREVAAAKPTTFPIGGDELSQSLGDPPVVLVRLRKNKQPLKYVWLVGGEGEEAQKPLTELEKHPLAKNWSDIAYRLNEEVNDATEANTKPRSGDIVLLTDVENGFMEVNEADVLDGWHGGPTKFEAEVPLIFATHGDLSLVREAAAKVVDPSKGETVRTRHMAPIIVELFRTVRDRWRDAGP